MSSLETLIEEYTDWVINDPNLIDDVSQLIFDNGGEEYGLSSIKEKLTIIAENAIPKPPAAVTEEDVQEESTPQRITKNKPQIDSSRFITMNRADRDRLMVLIKRIESIIQNSHNGVTKTQLLKEMRKDNSHWRMEVGQLLSFLVIDGLVQLQNKRYYPYNVLLKSRERRVHRTIYELLSEGSLTLTELYFKTGYNGGKSRASVKFALQDLVNEGYVINDSKRWRWA
jgi:hypothetical protein